MWYMPSGESRSCLLERSSVSVSHSLASWELRRIELRDALGLVLLLLDKHDPRFERSAIRWLGRLLVEYPEIGFDAADDALGALRWLGGPYSNVARARLALLPRRIGEVAAARVLETQRAT
jgi:hypothetical protein